MRICAYFVVLTTDSLLYAVSTKRVATPSSVIGVSVLFDRLRTLMRSWVHSPCLQTDLSCYRLPCHPKPSSTTSSRSAHLRHGYTVYWEVSCSKYRASDERSLRRSSGAPAGFENVLLRGAWSKSDGGARVAVGGADRTVTVWNVETGQIRQYIPDHTL